MDIIYVLLPLSLFFGICGLLAYLWSVRSGQFEDLETPAHRILFEDEPAEKTPGKEPEKREDQAS